MHYRGARSAGSRRIDAAPRGRRKKWGFVMATVSFANMDQAFDITNNAFVAFSGFSGSLSGFEYSYVTTGAHDWEFDGTGITTSGNLPTGGTVNKIQVDLNDDAQTLPEIVISGLGGIAATSFGVGVGTADQQRDKFWMTALGAADTINFTMANYSVDLKFAGDGANLDDGLNHVGGDDSLNGGAAALTGSSVIAGDYYYLYSGSATGGDDLITVGANFVYGDFVRPVGGTSATGGDDVIAPIALANAPFGGIYIGGDAGVMDMLLNAGDDLIDLRATNVSALTFGSNLFGDVEYVNPGGMLHAGDDTIHGSSKGDAIYGDFIENNGSLLSAGDDSLLGYAGADTIKGNDGRDYLSGGDDADVLDGGAGVDSLYGGNGNDSLLGDAQSDVIFGEGGDDTIEGGTGNDVVDGGTQKDRAFGGSGADSMSGGGGNDTLQGGNDNDTLVGGAAFDVFEGGDGNDSIDGGDGNDYIYSNAGNDTIVFALGGGTDTVRDFSAGAAIGDVIRLVGFGAAFDSFAEVLAAATDNGQHTTIDLGAGDILILRNVLVSQLAANDFSFG
jgi:Ca2+-binding RTX toxin-like protein